MAAEAVDMAVDMAADTVEPDAGPVPCALSQMRQALQEPELAAFDRVGVSHIEGLLGRAQPLTGPARERLLQRGQAALEHLQARRRAALERAERAVERLEEFELDPHGHARQALKRHDLAAVQRLSRRFPQTSVRQRDRVRKRWEAALDAEVEKRGLSCPGTIEAPSAAAIHRAATLEKAIALYRDAMAAAAAELAVARAIKSMPLEAGRYHAGSVATRALRQMQAVPPYLRAQLARVEMLGLLHGYGQSALRAERKPAKTRSGRPRRKPSNGKTANSRRRKTAS